MEHLIVKVKGNEYKKIISGQVIFELPEQLENAIIYSHSCILEENEWFKIERFTDQSYCIDLLKSEFNSIDYLQYNSIDSEKLEYLCSYQNNNEFYFQKINKSHLLKKKMLSIGDDISYQENKKCIIINDTPDAIYLRNEDSLYFRKLSSITSIFYGIDEIYREATREEVDTFLNSDFIELDKDYSTNKVGIYNRKRIALALETLKGFKQEEKKKVFSYVAQYCPNLSFSNGSFSISSEEELKLLCFGIEQRFFTTPVGGEKRLANSIIKIE